MARWKIVKLEAEEIDGLRFGDVERCLAALDGRLDVRGWYHGAAGDRLLDERHAQLVSAMVELLRRYGWEVRVEVSFSVRGDRGSIDVLAWHAATRTVLVMEIKSELGAIEGTLRPFDIKYRLARAIARERFGWVAATVGRVLVLPEDRSARRAVERHEVALRASLPAHSRELRSWLRRPAGGIGGIWFLTDVQQVNAKRNPSSICRVRHRRPRSSGQATNLSQAG